MKLRFYYHNGTGGATGSRPKISIDNVTVNSVGISDNTPPAILSLTPDNNASGVSITTPFSITFDEPIAAGTGGIQLFKEAGATDVLVPTNPVTIEGATASFTATSPLESSQNYYVLVDANAFTDQASPTPNTFPGILSETAWTLTTAAVDTSRPAVAALSPVDDSITAIPTTDLTITFNEPIAVGSGTILIKNAEGSTVDSFTLPSTRVSVSGNSATINPNVILNYGTFYYIQFPEGAFKDLSDNLALAISDDTTWNFTIRNAPSVVISQYYEGLASADRYVELRNVTSSPVSLDGYQLAVWSDSAPDDNEGWKSGTGTTTRITSLDGSTIPANSSFLVTSSTAATPIYAAVNHDLGTASGAVFFNGDDSVVLYKGAGFTREEVVDALSISAVQAADISFYRPNDNSLPGFDFSVGTSALDFPSAWATKPLADVNTAAETDAWYLKASLPPQFITLSITPSSFSEGAGPGAATGTVTRSGPTDGPLQVLITFSNDVAVSVADVYVTIPDGLPGAAFSIDAINDSFLDGDQSVTVTASVTGFLPDSETITILDEPNDVPFPVVINEVDSDQTDTDTGEFIELYNNSNAPVTLDGVVLVLYNGSNDLAYDTIDLSGKTIGANDYFVIGSSTVANVDMEEFISDGLQNGADAVALYLGSPTDFPLNTPVSPAKGLLVDALVYDTNDADDTGLIAALTPGIPQVNENSNSLQATESLSRVPNGGVAFASALFVAQAPTPGVSNVLAPSNTFASWISGYPEVGTFTGPNDDYDKDGLVNIVENILGGNPAVSGTGVSFVSGNATTVTFRHSRSVSPASDLTAGYEWSANLTNWYPSGTGGGLTVAIGAPVVITPATPTAPNELVEVTASVTSGSATKLFVRLKVSNP